MAITSWKEKRICDLCKILRRPENLPTDVLFVQRFGGDPEHPVVHSFSGQAGTQVILPLGVAESEEDAELAESPLLLAQFGVVVLVIFLELPDDRRFAFAVVPYLRALDLKEIVERVSSFGLGGVGDAEVRVGVNGFLMVDHGLMPSEDELMFLAKLLEVDVELGELHFVPEDVGFGRFE